MAAIVEKTKLEKLVEKLQGLRQWYEEVTTRPASKDPGTKLMVSLIFGTP